MSQQHFHARLLIRQILILQESIQWTDVNQINKINLSVLETNDKS